MRHLGSSSALAGLRDLHQAPDLFARTIDLHFSQYHARYKFGELHGARANLAEAERLAVELNDSARLGRILAEQTYILGSAGQIAEAIRTGERAVALADRSDDFGARVNSYTQLARALYAKGWYRQAIGHLHRVIEMLEEDVPRGNILWA